LTIRNHDDYSTELRGTAQRTICQKKRFFRRFKNRFVPLSRFFLFDTLG
jgi:hypothetical protein